MITIRSLHKDIARYNQLETAVGAIQIYLFTPSFLHPPQINEKSWETPKRLCTIRFTSTTNKRKKLGDTEKTVRSSKSVATLFYNIFVPNTIFVKSLA